MELRRRVNDFVHKIKDQVKLKGRFKKKLTNCYWPEFTRYCGCCDIATGIYIRSILTTIIATVAIAVNGAILDYLLRIEDAINGLNLTGVEEYAALFRDGERDQATLLMVYRAMVIYYIIWIGFKSIYMLSVIFTAFALYRKNSCMLKILLLISIPNCVFDFFIVCLAMMMNQNGLTTILVICALSEVYNILAINSAYKRLTGKLRIVEEFVASEPPVEPIYVNDYNASDQDPNGYNRLHCRSCTCYVNITHTPNVGQIEEAAIPITVDVNENSNNFVTTPSNENAQNPSNDTLDSDLVLEAKESTDYVEVVAVRPNTISLELKVKVDDADVPVIYDEDQLNVGLSPVIEDRRITSSNE